MSEKLEQNLVFQVVKWIHQEHVTEFEDVIITGCDDHPEWTLVLDNDQWAIKQVVAAVELERKIEEVGINS